MINEIQKLLEDYRAWLRDKTSLRQIDKWIEITTPYLDRHNDYIQIYASKENSGYLLTDDGYTIADLEESGCKLQSPKRHDLLKMTLNGFGIKLHDSSLEVHASSENFAMQKHNLVQAILAINDMFYLAEPLVTSLFYEDVVRWLDLHEVRYSPKVNFTGKSGYIHLYDFLIPKSRQEPERILRTINRPSRDTAEAIAFSWIDTRETRPLDSKAYAILNDTEQPVATAVLSALKNYDVQPIPWSKRESIVEELRN
ncbi:MAG: DUF1829 domain-containing protein [Armatimonadota bacterium]